MLSAQDKRNPDGLHMHCKICRKRKSAPTASEVAVTEKACSRCGEKKGASSFYVDKQAQCGLEAQCKECRRASRRLVTEVHLRGHCMSAACGKTQTQHAAVQYSCR